MLSTFMKLSLFTDTATTYISTLSLHDALPISCTRIVAEILTSRPASPWSLTSPNLCSTLTDWPAPSVTVDRKSTRLNSSHPSISYAVFCLKKKNMQAVPLVTQQHKGDIRQQCT